MLSPLSSKKNHSSCCVEMDYRRPRVEEGASYTDGFTQTGEQVW